eukprot:Em0006g174a
MAVTSPSVDQLTVTWTPPTTGGVPTSYNVTINDNSSPVVIADNGSPVYTHTFTGLVSDTLYTVSVVAINCAGSSNGTSFVKRTMALPPDNTTIKAVSVFNPNNTLRHLEITWTPVGDAVTIYGVYLGGGIHGNTSCAIPQCFYVVPVSVASTSYVISVNKDGDVGPKSNTTIYGTTNNTIINSVTAVTGVTMATIACSFLNNQSFYCMVCCSTDPSVPPDSSVYNISTTRGTEVTVSLQGLTSGQMYYCKAAATNTNSNNCAGSVVGGVKVFFSFISATITAMCTVQSTVPPPSRCGNTIHGMCTERQAFVVSLVLKPFHVKVYTRDICEMRKQYGLKEIENPLFQSQQMYIGICQLKCCTLNCYILVTRQKYTLSTLPLKTITGSQTTTLGALQLHDSQFDIRLDELTTSDTVQEFKAVIFKDSTGRVHQTSHSHDQMQYGLLLATFNTSSDTTHCLVQGFH